MIDIKLIRENPEDVKRRLLGKEIDCSREIDRILSLDTERRDLIFNTESCRSEQNKASKQIPAMKKAGEDVAPVLAQMNRLKEEIKTLDQRLKQVEEEYQGLMFSLPNLPDPDLVFGGKREQ